MRRLLFVLTAMAILTLSVLPLSAQAGSKPKSMTVSGDVTAVALDSLTVKIKTADTKFMIDKETSVTAKGATHKTLALKAEAKASTLTQFVKVGDQVSVTYHDMGANKIAE